MALVLWQPQLRRRVLIERELLSVSAEDKPVYREIFQALLNAEDHAEFQLANWERSYPYIESPTPFRDTVNHFLQTIPALDEYRTWNAACLMELYREHVHWPHRSGDNVLEITGWYIAHTNQVFIQYFTRKMPLTLLKAVHLIHRISSSEYLLAESDRTRLVDQLSLELQRRRDRANLEASNAMAVLQARYPVLRDVATRIEDFVHADVKLVKRFRIPAAVESALARFPGDPPPAKRTRLS